VRVFVSYSHDSEAHREWVLDLASRLRRDGVDAWIDRYSPAPAEGWPRWTQRRIEEAEFVLVVCTETYRRRFDGVEEAGVGRGATLEGLLVSQIMVEEGMRNEKFLPLLPDGEPEGSIPRLLRSYTKYGFPSGYQELLATLTRQPEVVPPPLGGSASVETLAESLAIPPLSEGAPPSVQVKFRILVVDDEPRWRTAIAEALEEIGTDTIVDVAESLSASRRLVWTQAYSLVVVDLALGVAPLPPLQADELGLDLLAEIRRSSLNQGCAVIVLSGYPEWRLYDLLQEYQVSFLPKHPFDDRELCSRARTAILRARLQSSRPPWPFCLTIAFEEERLLRSELVGATKQGHLANQPFHGSELARRTDEIAVGSGPGLERGRALQEIRRELEDNLTTDEQLLGPLLAEEMLSASRSAVKAPPAVSPMALRFTGPASGLGIPFELLGQGENRAWGLRRVLFRHLDLPDHVSQQTQSFARLVNQLLKERKELRILFVAGGGEQGKIYDLEIEELAREVERDLLELSLPCRVSQLTSARASVFLLRQMIRDGRPHVLHYSGPGRRDLHEHLGIVLKEGAVAENLAKMVESPDLHLVALNAFPGTSMTGSFASALGTLVRADVPVVLGHRWPLSDRDGRLLSAVFYRELWRTFSPGEALLAARRALAERGEDEDAWSSPVLILQNS